MSDDADRAADAEAAREERARERREAFERAEKARPKFETPAWFGNENPTFRPHGW